MANNIGYHTRSTATGFKVVGGSFGGSIDMETVNRLVSVYFSVVVLPSGNATFVDEQGRQVTLYISVDPAMTDKGKAALVQDQIKRKEEAEKKENEREFLQEQVDALSNDELRRLLAGRKESL